MDHAHQHAPWDPPPQRIIVDVAVAIERLRIARRPTLAPGCGRHCIMRRDRQRASTEHDAIRADKAPKLPTETARGRNVDCRLGLFLCAIKKKLAPYILKFMTARLCMLLRRLRVYLLGEQHTIDAPVSAENPRK